MTTAFCAGCGRPAGEGAHLACARRRDLEPPRYCPRCARRMVVQVTPASWSARCGAHGAMHPSADWDPELV